MDQGRYSPPDSARAVLDREIEEVREKIDGYAAVEPVFGDLRFERMGDKIFCVQQGPSAVDSTASGSFGSRAAATEFHFLSTGLSPVHPRRRFSPS